MSLDIIIYAVIAIALFLRLWTVFGRRNDEDQERPNPFITPPPPPQAMPAPQAPAGETPPLLRPFRAAPASLAGGLEQIKALDPAFDEKQFLQGAKQAFTTIVEDFAKDDLSRIEKLLGPQVLPLFRNAIAARQKAGQKMECKVIAIRDAETARAKTDGSNVLITVRFVSAQQIVLRDSAGKIIGGEEGKSEEMTDLWTFARDTKSFDPNWLLVETKS